MSNAANSALAARFRAAHERGRILVLPNAWDVGSARLIEDSGAEAIATSSAAIAWSNGYPDGELLPLDVLLAATKAIAAAVSAPVTVDLEAGFSDDPTIVAANVLRVLDAGAVGVNLEDGSGTPELLALKIRAVRAATSARGLDVFVNARTDVYLRGLAPPAAAAEETIRRARLYAEAGADGIFALRLTSSADIEAIVRGTPLPLNVMATPGIAPIPELRRLGVRRVSSGAGLIEAALSATRRACLELLQQGTYTSLFVEDINYMQMNALFERR